MEITWPVVVLSAINVVQLVLLTWISAWQQRAAQLVRRNGVHLEPAAPQHGGGLVATPPE